MLCAKFDWNWPSGSGEEDFFNFVNVFSLFGNYSPLEKDRVLHLKKLDSPSPKNALSQVWFKLALWFWRRRLFFNFVNVYSLFHNYLPLEKGRALPLKKLEFPLSKDALWQVWLKFAQRFWRRRWKCEKFTKTDKFWSEKLTWAFGSGELKTKKKNYLRVKISELKVSLIFLLLLIRRTSSPT